MLAEDAYFATLGPQDLWKRYCGFLDLSREEFRGIQTALLAEQLELVQGSELGRRILGPRPPRTVEDFRNRAPLTTYQDYEPFLSEKREDALAAPPLLWCHSSGRGGRFKWVPQSEQLMDKSARHILGICILSSASRRGEIRISPGLRFLTTLPPAPYTSGTLFAHWRTRFTFRPIPAPEEVEGLAFADRIARVFEIALRDGFDVGGAMASVLVRMGQQLSGRVSRTRRPGPAALHPRALLRLAGGWLRSRLAGRPIYPRDLWRPTGILAGGVDMDIYRGDIQEYWGIPPFDAYAATETMFLGMQGWNRRHLTFLPDSVFLEFLPSDGGESEAAAGPTVLADELEAGRLYELVVTQFHGMPLLRYRLGDLIRVVADGDEETGVRLPQIEVRRKVGESINLAGLCNLDERTIWRAIKLSGLRYADWAAVKEYHHTETFLRVLIELKDRRPAADVSRLIDAALKEVDPDYRDIGRYLQTNPVRTTVLCAGAYARYVEQQVREGVDLAHLKPGHINPPAAVLAKLAGVGGVEEIE